jgi:hypothetical protein
MVAMYSARDADPEDLDLPCVVEIRRNADGLVRQDKSHRFRGAFIWGDGNYACDCNRALFFASVVGEDDPDRECGSEVYSLRVLSTDGAHVLYEDDDWQR